MLRTGMGVMIALSVLAGCGTVGPGARVPSGDRAPIGAPGELPSDPAAPLPGGIAVFFTDTYAAAKGGVSSMSAMSANQAAAEADPNNPDKQLAALIDAARPGSTLDGAFYDIGVEDVVQAFANAARRGVRVRLVTDSGYYADKSGALRAPILELRAAGVPVKPRPASLSGLMHDKFLVIDGQSVWTGSYNITDGGSYADNNNALRIDSPALAATYQAEFEKMFTRGNFGADNGSANHPPSLAVTVDGAQITPYFSPCRANAPGAKTAILQALDGAQRSIKFLAFAFTDKDMGDAMRRKAQAGVTVQGVFERGQAASQYCQYHALAQAEASSPGRIDVRLDNNPGLMHHKVIVVDDQTLMIGSFNFSTNAEESNDENMLVIKNCPALVARYEAEFARILALASADGQASSDAGEDGQAASSAAVSAAASPRTTRTTRAKR